MAAYAIGRWPRQHQHAAGVDRLFAHSFDDVYGAPAVLAAELGRRRGRNEFFDRVTYTRATGLNPFLLGDFTVRSASTGQQRWGAVSDCRTLAFEGGWARVAMLGRRVEGCLGGMGGVAVVKPVNLVMPVPDCSSCPVGSGPLFRRSLTPTASLVAGADFPVRSGVGIGLESGVRYTEAHLSPDVSASNGTITGVVRDGSTLRGCRSSIPLNGFVRVRF
jgi:hypothetical protein